MSNAKQHNIISLIIYQQYEVKIELDFVLKDESRLKVIIKNYGVTGSWTQGLLHAKQALYQLSYNPVTSLCFPIKTSR